MKKVDLIKFRCTPEFKARVAREATYRGVSLSEFVEGAIENELRAVFRAGVAEASKAMAEGPEAVVEYLTGDRVIVDGEQAKVVGVPITPGLKPVPFTDLLDEDDLAVMREDAEPGLQHFIATNTRESTPLTQEMLDRAIEAVAGKPKTGCPHGRPPAACWECA